MDGTCHFALRVAVSRDCRVSADARARFLLFAVMRSGHIGVCRGYPLRGPNGAANIIPSHRGSRRLLCRSTILIRENGRNRPCDDRPSFPRLLVRRDCIANRISAMEARSPPGTPADRLMRGAGLCALEGEAATRVRDAPDPALWECAARASASVTSRASKAGFSEGSFLNRLAPIGQRPAAPSASRRCSPTPAARCRETRAANARRNRPERYRRPPRNRRR
jgi:hypothetical protein